MHDLLAYVPGALLACAFFAALALSSHAVAARLLRDGSPRLRLCGAVLVAYAILEGLFVALSVAGLFRWWAAAAALAVICLLARASGRGLREDLSAAGGVLSRALRSWLAVPVLIGSCFVAARLFRALVAPPLVWDALTYHLFKAGRWAQGAGLMPAAAPNSWGYFEHFPHGGDVLWAWALLLPGGEGLLGWAGLIVWLAGLLAVYALARELGAGERTALLAALCVGFTPACVNHFTTCNVENVTLAMFALASLFLARVLTSARPAEAALAGLALGAVAAVKVPNLAVAAVGAIALLHGIARSGAPDRPRAALAAGLGLLIAAPTYLTTWLSTGSPIYPFELAVGGRVLLRGDPAITNLMASATAVPGSALAHWIRALFLPLPSDFAVQGQFVNLGPAIAILGVCAVIGLRRLPARGRSLALAVHLVGSSAIVVLLALLPSAAAQRTVFAGISGRFLLVPVAVAAVLAALLPSRVAERVLLAGLVLALPLAVPLGWGPPDLAAALPFAITLAVAGLILGSAYLLRTAGAPSPPSAAPSSPASDAGGPDGLTRMPPAGFSASRGLAAGISVCAVLVLLVQVERIRGPLRYPYYAAVAAGEAFDVGKGSEILVRAWPAWRLLDGPSPARIAIAAGWDGMAPVTARYPFLGSDLQNEVLYLPILRGGAVSTRPEDYETLSGTDFAGWLRQIVDRRVDFVALLPPGSVEGTWIAAHETIFRPRLTVESAVSVFEVQRDRGREWLARTDGSKTP